MNFAYHTIEVGAELLDICALGSRDEDARGVLLCKPALLQVVERTILLGGRGEVILLLRGVGVGINLVEDQVDRLLARANILQGLLHNIDLLLELRVRNIHHVNQQVGFAYLVQGLFERLDKLGRELANETYGVGQEKWKIVEDNLAHSSIERSKEFVFGEDLALRDEVH